MRPCMLRTHCLAARIVRKCQSSQVPSSVGRHPIISRTMQCTVWSMWAWMSPLHTHPQHPSPSESQGRVYFRRGRGRQELSNEDSPRGHKDPVESRSNQAVRRTATNVADTAQHLIETAPSLVEPPQNEVEARPELGRNEPDACRTEPKHVVEPSEAWSIRTTPTGDAARRTPRATSSRRAADGARRRPRAQRSPPMAGLCSRPRPRRCPRARL